MCFTAGWMSWAGRWTMANPVFEREGEGRYTGLIMPVYPLTAGVSNHLMAGLARRAVEVCAPEREEILPEPLRLTYGLCQVEYAYRNIHFPKDFEALELARRRLVFEELLVLTCGMALLKERRGQGAGRGLDRGRVEDFLSLLPFSPTGAQRRAMEDMAADLASGRAMNRLVQGDVGSGKTAVAAFGGLEVRPKWLPMRPDGRLPSCWRSSTPGRWTACSPQSGCGWACSPDQRRGRQKRRC